ncbi:hypothetical protein QUF90_09685 [Desulfococcaceae bacterium HSG9]|nr:hypothetical protein [Desulfococcaceae bacterium HSG9]
MMLIRTVIVFFVMVFICAVSYAEDKIKHLPIKPVPAIEKPDQVRFDNIEHGIAEIESIGMVDRIADDEVVIGDTLFRFASEAEIYSQDSEQLSKTDIIVGNIVGWMLNEKGEIAKLWKLAKPQ